MESNLALSKETKELVNLVISNPEKVVIDSTVDVNEMFDAMLNGREYNFLETLLKCFKVTDCFKYDEIKAVQNQMFGVSKTYTLNVKLIGNSGDTLCPCLGVSKIGDVELRIIGFLGFTGKNKMILRMWSIATGNLIQNQ